MRASEIVRQLCRHVVGFIDARRTAVLLCAIDALLAGGSLSLTALGRALDSGAAPKHRIKRIDRFLGNGRAWNDRFLYYSALAQRLLGQSRRPVLLIDWTVMPTGHYALVAAIPALGRSIPIYSEVHPKEKLGNRAVQTRFLAFVASILPPRSRPVIVADAGFKSPFFRVVDDMGWDFVIRLRGDCALKRDRPRPRELLPFKRAFARALDDPRSLGDWIPYAGGDWRQYRIVIGAKPTKKRRHAGFYEKRALEPWLLATTIRAELPRVIVDIYAMRMQIEETFRDTKNARLGWGLEHANSRSPQRQELLFLIATLAFAATVLAGAAVEARGDARLHQANTVRGRRVLSVLRLGTHVLSSKNDLSIREVVTKRMLVAVYVQRPFQRSLPFTRLRDGRWL